ncbi:MAG TPA: class I SAM-dependent methyltransferase [Steroidobacteraceae bacterium]|nr:class I SAM-dependent methyltransferase [Steroidobacteraceae bacterium]
MAATTGVPEHWDAVYGRRAFDQVSWFEPVPQTSLDWIAKTEVRNTSAIIDVGGGASTLVDELVGRGFTDVTVLDISDEVLRKVAARLGAKQRFVTLEAHDVTTYLPSRPYELWHDRAVFHFLTDTAGRLAYRHTMERATKPGSHVLISTFGPEGPTRCSGLSTARYDAEGLATELGSSFRLVNSAISVHVTPSGSQQQFLNTQFVRI